MQEIVEKNKCCGCHACFNICPKNAISMIEDEKGFRYPSIDKTKCIDCGMCKKVCPVLNNQEKEHNIKAYACYNINHDERLHSSSGGIFILLAKEVIKRNGVVFGASFDEDFNLYHTFAENKKDLKQFMGSKYVQSAIGETYKKVKYFLDNDRYVLFTGTPCQIEGLLSYLKKDYNKLYTQDIICHGVPSPKVWQKYLEYQKKLSNENVKSVSFRSKDHGWSLFRMKILFDTKKYSKNHNDDLFMKVFLKNLCLRESCYNCSFKKKYRSSDITLGDYWGINKLHQKFNDNKGTSLLIINSDKGEKLFDAIKNNIKYIETDLDTAIKYNSAMVESVKHHNDEKDFINNIDNMSFDKLVNKYIPKPPFHKRIIRKIKNIIKTIIKI